MGIICSQCAIFHEEKDDDNEKYPQKKKNNYPKANIDNKNKSDINDEDTIFKFDNEGEGNEINSISDPNLGDLRQSKTIYYKDKGKNKKAKKINNKFAVKNIKLIENQNNDNDEQVFQRRKKRNTTLIENNNLLNNLYSIQMKIPIAQELLVQKQKGNPNNKYIRGKKLGQGTFGSVYKAKNIIFSNYVAMKIIPKKSNMDVVLINNEIDILKKLSHPNIVRIFEFYESKNCFYLINDFCPVGELYDFINQSSLNEEQLAVIFYQVFSGLQFLHANNITHRDLKPENILISKKEINEKDGLEYFWIQIIDFGTAKIFQSNQSEKSIVGSAYYIAPEVLNKKYNEKCDNWSVGVIMYMFLTGKPPFNGRNNEEVIKSIKTCNYNAKDEVLLTRSPEVRDLIKHLLDKNISKRFSAKEALNHEWFKKYNGRKIFENFKEEDIKPYIDNLFKYTVASKIQQLVIAFLVHNLPHTESSHNILKLYRYFNKSGDCRLTKEELFNGLAKYIDEKEVKKKVDNLFTLLDNDNDGYIEYEEFLRACVNKKEILNDEYLKYAFKFLDKNKKNKLSSQEICSLFLIEKNKLYEAAIIKSINDLDLDGDSFLNFEEFKKLMNQTMN